MPALEQLRDDWRVLWRMLRGMPSGASHAERLQAFYLPQADRYDTFRERLLSGREELIAHLPLPARAHVIELGGGTGRNIDFFGSRLEDIESFEVVDLCPALLDLARRRWRSHPQVRVTEADASRYQPRRPVDCVYFSYALTMIPEWRAALHNAWAMLKPDGVIGVVDFFVSDGRSGNPWRSFFERVFWPRWFAHDGVHLNAAHLEVLRGLFAQHEIQVRHARIPYVPGMRVPYYLFIGRKKAPP